MEVKGDSINQAMKNLLGMNAVLFVGGGAIINSIPGAGNAATLLVTKLTPATATAALKTSLIALGITEAAMIGTQAVFYGINTHAANVHCTTTAGKTPGCFALILAPLEQEKSTRICQNIQSIP